MVFGRTENAIILMWGKVMNMKTLYDYLNVAQLVQPHGKLLGDRNGWFTTEQTHAWVDSAAGKLAGLGLKRGSVAALRMSQCKESVILLLALQAIGVLSILTGYHQEIHDALDGVDLTVKPELFLWEQDGVWLAEYRGKVHQWDRLPCRPFSVSDHSDAPAFVIFTSGSTGKQKGVILSQWNLISNLLDSANLGGYSEDDIALGALPLCHVFGLALMTGAIVLRHSLYITPGAELNTVLQAIEREKITRMNGVPSLYLRMAEQRQRYDLRSLRVGFIGGAPCTSEQFEKIETELDMILVPVYGMSECVGISCASWRDSRQERIGGVGRFYSMNEGKILRSDGKEANPGEVGEVCVRGAMRFLGYSREEQTRETVDADGFLHTGDLGYLDERGILHLTGRKKDIIIRNGINLSPRKIEEALLNIPGVTDATVVGIDHPVQGQVPCAIAVTSRTELELLALLTSRLHKNEIPMGIHIVDKLPRTASGKPDKETIREVLQAWAKV